MKSSYIVLAGFFTVIVTSFAFIMSTMWYLQVIAAVVTGYYARTKLGSLALGIGSTVGAAIYIFAISSSAGLAQASLVGGIIGIPGGYAVLLAITMLIMFGITFLGALFGSSFDLSGSPKEGEKEAE